MPGTVITVMNMKGGVGKTTLSLHVSGILARYTMRNEAKRKKVLAIDYDPQFNMSQSFLEAKAYFTAEKAKKTTLSILTDDDDDLDPYVLQVPGNHNPPSVASLAINIFNHPDGGQLDVVPSTLDLMYVALGQATTNTKPIIERFDKFIEEARSIYDYVILDCHPAGSIFTQTSLRNSDHVVIPVAPQRYAVRGVGLMFDFISAKNVGTKGPQPHIVFNLVPRSGTAKQETEIRSEKKFAPYCLKNTLKKYSAFSEPEGGTGFVWHSAKPYSTEAFTNALAVTRELVDRFKA